MSVTDDIENFYGMGMTRRQISLELEIDYETVKGVVYRLKNGVGPGMGPKVGPRPAMVMLSPLARKTLSAAAAVRGIGIREIAARLLETIAAEPCLIDNVLDDGGK
jgi:hypothetical protein